MATELFAKNKYELGICLCDGHLEEGKAAGAHIMTTTGIFLKQEQEIGRVSQKTSQEGERVPFREERNFPQVLSVYVGLAKTKTGTLEEVGLVAEQVSLSMTSTQAALSVIFLSSSFLNFAFFFSQTLLRLSLVPSSHTPKVPMCAEGKKALGDLEDEPGNHQKAFPLCYQPLHTLLHTIAYVIGDPR